MNHQPTEKEQNLAERLNELYAGHRATVRETYPEKTLDGCGVLRLAKTDTNELTQLLAEMTRRLFETTTNTLGRYPHINLDTTYRDDYDAYVREAL